MVKIISFGSNKKSSKDSKGFFFTALLKSLWNLFSSQDKFTKFFIIIALIIAIISPNFVAKYFIRAVPPSPSVGLEGETLAFSGPVISGTDSLASNGGYILFDTYSSTVSAVPCVTLPPEGAGVASGKIIIPKDNYYFVWSRLRGEGDGANSYYLQIDNNCLINIGDQKGMSSNAWTWINYQNGNPLTLIMSNLTAGTHTIRLIGREAKTSLDKLIFTSGENCSPINTGGNCLHQPAAQSGTSALTVTPAPISGKTASILISPSPANITTSNDFLFYKIVLGIKDNEGVSLKGALVTLDPQASTEIPGISQPYTETSNSLGIVEFSNVPKGIYKVKTEYENKKLSERVLNIKGSSRIISLGIGADKKPADPGWFLLGLLRKLLFK